MNILTRRIAELEKRRPPSAAQCESVEARIERVRAMLIAAFGEADIAEAERLYGNQLAVGDTNARA